MLTFPRIELARQSVFMRELTLGEAIQLARMPTTLLEARLTAFLGFVLNNKDLPLKLTVQERYYLLMTYQLCHEGHDLAIDSHYARYFLAKDPSKAWQDSLSEGGLTVTHMTGQHAEILEELCEDLPDWLLGAMAMQCHAATIPNYPILPENAPKDTQAQVMRDRIAALEALPESEFDSVYGVYARLNDRLAYFVKTGVDDTGFVVLGGADDAPVRFRTTASLGQFSTFLAHYLAQKSAESSQPLPNES